MKRLVFILLTITAFMSASAASPLYNILQKSGDKDNERWNSARQEVLSRNFDLAISLYNAEVELQKSKRSQGRQVSEELLSEYAYALALAQIQSEALKVLDIAMSLESNKGVSPFYIFSILYLTGHPEIVDILSGTTLEKWCAQSPGWLRGYAFDLNKQYAAPSDIEIPDDVSGIKHLRLLMSQDRKTEALAYADVFTKTFPNNQTGFLLASAVWEKFDCYSTAYAQFKKAQTLASAPGALMTETSMQKQGELLLERSEKIGNRPAFGSFPMTFISAGIGYASKSFSIQGRYGVSNGPLSISFDVSFIVPDKGDFTSNYGATCYYRWRTLVTGMGIALNDSKFSFAPTVGLSFLNKKGTSSFDIMMNCYLPTSSGSKTSLTISIGKTFYFKL